MHYDNIEYEIGSQEIIVDKKHISLGRIEHMVFEELISNQGITITKEDLMDLTENQNPTALRVLIKSIKDKTGLNIQNIRGIGYLVNEK